jgi:hypothetical protein
MKRKVAQLDNVHIFDTKDLDSKIYIDIFPLINKKKEKKQVVKHL